MGLAAQNGVRDFWPTWKLHVSDFSTLRLESVQELLALGRLARAVKTFDDNKETSLLVGINCSHDLKSGLACVDRL